MHRSISTILHSTTTITRIQLYNTATIITKVLTCSIHHPAHYGMASHSNSNSHFVVVWSQWLHAGLLSKDRYEASPGLIRLSEDPAEERERKGNLDKDFKRPKRALSTNEAHLNTLLIASQSIHWFWVIAKLTTFK